LEEFRNFPENQYHVALGSGVASLLNPAEFPANFTFYPICHGVVHLGNFWKIQSRMKALESRVNQDCVITTSGPAFWRPSSPHLVGFNRPLFIYHESPYLQSLSWAYKARIWAERTLHCHYFRSEANAYIVQTNDVNQRVRSLLHSDEVHTISNTFSSYYEHPIPKARRLPEKRENCFRLLTLSSYYEHKNLELIQKVIEFLPVELRHKTEFVLTITEKEYKRFISRKIPPEVKLIGPVPAPECPSLYMECDFMFLPTLAECFSASYPEAMKMEKPIITTDLEFAHSICGPAACYFHPKNAQDAANKIVELVQDNSLRSKLIDAGRSQLERFDTPQSRAKKILDLCRGLVEKYS
jgi:glycosyltransferase involved in cell wall biosynthesis